MRHDLEIPERYGIRQSVGDTVGPGGISRALRNVPVLVGIARDMQEICPDAWLLNLTNPMTALCRAVTRETPIKTIGLCHELTMTRFTLSLLLDADFRAIDLAGHGREPPARSSPRSRSTDATASPRCATSSTIRAGQDEPLRSTCPTTSASALRTRRAVDPRRPPGAQPAQARAVRSLRRAPGRGGPAPRRVLLRASSPKRPVGAIAGASTSPPSRIVRRARPATSRISKRSSRLVRGAVDAVG